MYSTYSTAKACIVERFNRTIKEKIYRQFTGGGSHDWISTLPKLMSEYNNSKHRTIGMTPSQADADSSRVSLKQRDISKPMEVKFVVGDKVRISTLKGIFEKSYLPRWSTEIFTIIRVNKTVPATFIL